MTENKSKSVGATPEIELKPLTTDVVKFNLYKLMTGRIMPPESNSLSFSDMGIFSVGLRYATRKGHSFSEPCWSEKLLPLSGRPHILKINELGNIEVYETQGKLITAQDKPRTILEPEDIRIVSDRLDIVEGEVQPSGFVIPKNRPVYILDNEQIVYSEWLEEMLLAAEKNNPSESRYHISRGFAKVDPSLVRKNILLIPFRIFRIGDIGDNDYMRKEAVAIDTEKQQLIPRIFYTLNPKD